MEDQTAPSASTAVSESIPSCDNWGLPVSEMCPDRDCWGSDLKAWISDLLLVYVNLEFKLLVNILSQGTEQMQIQCTTACFIGLYVIFPL